MLIKNAGVCYVSVIQSVTHVFMQCTRTTGALNRSGQNRYLQRFGSFSTGSLGYQFMEPVLFHNFQQITMYLYVKTRVFKH